MLYRKNKKILIQEALEHRILHGLGCEWETALWVLSSDHKKLMKKPLFSLGEVKTKLGCWDREKNEICLSRHFVLNHSWDAVRDVLLHEMAHQFAEKVLGARNEPPHGPKFRKACHLLRANPRSSNKYKPIADTITDDSPDSDDKIMLRIKKLMALAESHNRHEAESAMAKAHELIAKYNLNLYARNEKRNFVSVFLGKPALRRHREDYYLARLILDFYFVEGLWVSAYVIEKGKMGRVLEINGTLQNIKIAVYAHDFVRRFIDTRWDEYNTDKGLNRYRKTDFAVGIIEGFRSKLELQHHGTKTTKDRSALINIEDPALKQYVAYKYPHTKSFSRKSSNQDAGILEDGMRVGRTMVISKGITSKRKNKRLMIENKIC